MQQDQEERIKRFLAIASHDLQSPLRHIAMYADILLDELDGKLEPDHLQSLRIIMEKAQTAQRLTKALMSYAAGAPPILLEEIDIEALTRSVFDELVAERQVDGAVFAFSGERHLRSDRLILSLAFKALIENALLHAVAESLTLSMTVEAAERDMLIAVEDNGQGVEPAHRERIFDAFWKGQHAVGRPGLGLANSRMLLSALGGRIEAEASRHGGLRFVIALPKAQSQIV